MTTPNPRGFPSTTFPDAPTLLRKPNHWSWDVWADYEQRQQNRAEARIAKLDERQRRYARRLALLDAI